MAAGHRHRASSVPQDRDVLGGRNDRADDDAGGFNVRPEHTEWIGVTRLGERLERRVTLHGPAFTVSPVVAPASTSCPRMVID